MVSITSRRDLMLTTARQAGREARSRHMIAAEGLAAVGRMIAAYRRSDGAATYCKIAWVTVALRDLEGHGRCLGPDGFRASAVVDRCGPAGAARVRGGARIPARFGEQSLASGHGAT
jgi:hypothetical protein